MTLRSLAPAFLSLLLFARPVSSAEIAFGSFKDSNVLLITLDTTRADHLSLYGYARDTTPNLAILGLKSFVFENAISHIPLTLPSHTSILTGLLPPTHGVRDNSGYFLDPSHMTLAKILQRQGYATGAFVSSFVLDSRWQLNQGFDLYYDYFNLAEYKDINPRDVQRKAEETEVEAAHWIESNAAKKFFCWVHFYDPHDPYEPPERYRAEYADNLYDGEIAYTDEILGRLLKKLEDLHLKERTVIVVTGDHGESLGEHKENTHAIFIYDATQHIPLVITLPQGEGGRVPGIVRHIDIAPTVLELLGVHPLKEMQGLSLIPMMNGKEKSAREAYSESLYSELHFGWSGLTSLATNQYRYIQAPNPELYDRVHDPAEMHNLIAEKPDVAKKMQLELARLAGKNPAFVKPQKMDPETEEKLRALGYIGGSVEGTSEKGKIDPKDRIGLVRDLQKVFGLVKAGDYVTALRQAKSILDQDPSMVDAHLIAGIAYLGNEDNAGAIDEFLKAIRLKPDYTNTLHNLGYTYHVSGNLHEAERWYLEVLKYEPNHIQTCLRLAHLYREEKQPEKARMYFERVVGTYRESLQHTTSEKARSVLYATLAEVYFGAGDYESAKQCLKSAIALTPDHPTLHFNLAQIYEAGNAAADAVTEYEKETNADPTSFKAYTNLGILYREMGRFEDAIKCFTKVVELQPKDSRGYLLMSATYKKMGNETEAERYLKLANEQANISP